MKFSLIYNTIFTLGIALGHAGTLTKSDLTEPVDPAPTTADNSEALAKIAQNPVGNLISVPVQWNMGFGAGPNPTYQSTLNIQPVIPVTLNEDWSIITRTIFPVDSWPTAGDNHVAGIGDTTFTAFLSPGKPGKFIWGIGPAFPLPDCEQPRARQRAMGYRAVSRWPLHGQEHRRGRAREQHLVVCRMG